MTLARCVVPACPVRFIHGDDRLCRWHDQDDTADFISRASGISVMMAAPPGEREAAKTGGRPVAPVSNPGHPHYPTR